MESLAMGDYGAYVWSSFGLTFAVIVICIVQARRRHVAVVDDIRTRMAAMETQS